MPSQSYCLRWYNNLCAYIQRKGDIMKVTPGSWPARTPKNPVVPTTVKRKAACIIERCQFYEKEAWTNAVTVQKRRICTQSFLKFYFLYNISLPQRSSNGYGKKGRIEEKVTIWHWQIESQIKTVQKSFHQSSWI